MRAESWQDVLENTIENFPDSMYKPLIAVRNKLDFEKTLEKLQSYTSGFNIEYEKTLRHIIAELLYNTMEHGKAINLSLNIPSLIQFTWYQRVNELHFIIADLGVGIKRHLEQAYLPFHDDKSAILESLRPNVSGTFGILDPYKSKDNAGYGLFLSSNIIRRLNADMNIVSGNGHVHISPKDTTAHQLDYYWPGTFVLVNISLSNNEAISLQKLLSEFRQSAELELSDAELTESDKYHYLSVFNFFGKYAEDKESAIKYRDNYITPSLNQGKSLHIDFSNVLAAPHSFLSALLATPIHNLGMSAYKKIKITNAPPDIRETIDYILNENT